MKYQKYNLIFGFALVCVMLFTACENITDTLKIQKPVKNGYGKVSISFTGETALQEAAERTILPSTVFTHYGYTFTKAGQTTGEVKIPGDDGYFTLEVGSYTVAVQAYIGTEGSYTLAASGVSSPFTVDSGSNSVIKVFLSEAANANKGKFNYTITWPDGAEAEITLQQWPNMNYITLNPITQGNGKTQTLDLDVGSYLLTVLVSKVGFYAGMNEAIHIYPAVTTVFTKNFSDNDLLAEFPITSAEIIVTTPVKGAAPDTTASGTGNFTVGPASWSPADNLFLGGTVYTATVTLTANNRRTFTGLNSATVNGQNAAVSNNTGANVTLAYAFPATNDRTAAGIAIKTQPTRLAYTHGDPLDLTGLVVTLAYDDTTTEDVAAANFTAKGITANPSPGNRLVHVTHNGNPVTITYGNLTPLTTNNLTVTPKVTAFTVDPIPVQAYTGSAIQPTVTVKDGTTILTLNTDYTVAYANNTNAGTGTVTISGAGNYAGSSGSTVFTILVLQTVSSNRFEYYWIDQHGSLVTTSGGAVTIPAGVTLTITAQGNGYTVKHWRLNGVNTGQSGNSYNFSSMEIGKHTVGLFVEKGGNLYNTNIAITVETGVTVTFNINGGTGTTPASQVVLPGSGITLPDGSGFSRTGYTFGGWNTNTSGTGTNYNAGSSYTTPTTNITLYARWNSTVTFNINGGTGTTPASQTVIPGSSITLPNGSGLSRTGYTFGGWNTDSSGTGTNYNAGSSYTPSGNITLYARWNSTVTFNRNNGTGTAPASQSVPAGSSITLPDGSGLSRTGYTFGGWNTNYEGTGTNYSAGSSYTPSGNITLYATWCIPLTAGTWTSGSITSSASGSAVWYSFSVTSGTTYHVWWNDSRAGNSVRTLDIKVDAKYSNGTAIFTGEDSAWSSAQSFTANQTGTVILKVYPFTSGNTGTFDIVYTTSNNRP